MRTRPLYSQYCLSFCLLFFIGSFCLLDSVSVAQIACGSPNKCCLYPGNLNSWHLTPKEACESFPFPTSATYTYEHSEPEFAYNTPCGTVSLGCYYCKLQATNIQTGAVVNTSLSVTIRCPSCRSDPMCEGTPLCQGKDESSIFVLGELPAYQEVMSFHYACKSGCNYLVDHASPANSTICTGQGMTDEFCNYLVKVDGSEAPCSKNDTPVSAIYPADGPACSPATGFCVTPEGCVTNPSAPDMLVCPPEVTPDGYMCGYSPYGDDFVCYRDGTDPVPPTKPAPGETPGGVSKTPDGQFFWDQNGNGVMDPGEPAADYWQEPVCEPGQYCPDPELDGECAGPGADDPDCLDDGWCDLSKSNDPDCKDYEDPCGNTDGVCDRYCPEGTDPDCDPPQEGEPQKDGKCPTSLTPDQRAADPDCAQTKDKMGDGKCDPADAADWLDCSKGFDIPEPQEVPVDEQIIPQINPNKISFNAACPTSASIQVLGTSISISYDPLCDLVILLAPLGVLLSWLRAAWIVFSALRT